VLSSLVGQLARRTSCPRHIFFLLVQLLYLSKLFLRTSAAPSLDTPAQTVVHFRPARSSFSARCNAARLPDTLSVASRWRQIQLRHGISAETDSRSSSGQGFSGFSASALRPQIARACAFFGSTDSSLQRLRCSIVLPHLPIEIAQAKVLLPARGRNFTQFELRDRFWRFSQPIQRFSREHVRRCGIRIALKIQENSSSAQSNFFAERQLCARTLCNSRLEGSAFDAALRYLTASQTAPSRNNSAE